MARMPKANNKPKNDGEKKSGKNGWVDSGRLDSKNRPIYVKTSRSVRNSDFKRVNPMEDIQGVNTNYREDVDDDDLLEIIPAEYFTAVGMTSDSQVFSSTEPVPLYGLDNTPENLTGYAVSNGDGTVDIVSKDGDNIATVTPEEWNRMTALNFIDMVETLSDDEALIERHDDIKSAYLADDGSILLEIGSDMRGDPRGEIHFVPTKKKGIYEAYYQDPEGGRERIDEDGVGLDDAASLVDSTLDVRQKNPMSKAAEVAAASYGIFKTAKRSKRKMERHMRRLRRGNHRNDSNRFPGSGFLEKMLNKAFAPLGNV